MDKMRERFEAAIKRPPGVFWNEASGEYDGSQSYYAQLAETYQAAWDAWQAALSQAEPVEKTFGEGIDVSYQDLFSQWQADHELQLKTEKPAPLPQPVASDVEEFIAAHDYDKEDMCSGCVPSSALREWMAGHARVKIDILETILEVVRGKLNEAYQNAMSVCCGKAGQECCGSPVAEWSAADMELMDSLAPIEKAISAMLTARKDGMESAASQQEGV